MQKGLYFLGEWVEDNSGRAKSVSQSFRTVRLVRFRADLLLAHLPLPGCPPLQPRFWCRYGLVRVRVPLSGDAMLHGEATHSSTHDDARM